MMVVMIMAINTGDDDDDDDDDYDYDDCIATCSPPSASQTSEYLRGRVPHDQQTDLPSGRR